MGNKVSRANYAPAVKKRPRLSYRTFEQINGQHPWRQAVPGAYVDYQVRKRSDGKVLYFNFDLAKEIGLIPVSHSHELNQRLESKILETFALQIINEYDIKKQIRFPAKSIKPNRYMATRYLQLQHKNKIGKTSGDGRSIWNGYFEHNGITWDFSSCGTGVTRLSPGAVEAQKPIRTGSGHYSYGSGCAGLDEGISCALQSELFHQMGVETERVLAIIELPGSTAINVRASKNLIRPSHLFVHLKQENLPLLTSSTDYFIDRQIQNAKWPIAKNSVDKYDKFLQILARTYAEFAAQLEDQYIFCWMDWDGDNMLATGGIIDYGSIRQFGLCHDHYRYDDSDRWSTNLSEQKNKARYIVQTFAQLVNYLNTGRKKRLEYFKTHSSLKLFDETFEKQRDLLLLRRIGFNKNQCDTILRKYKKDFHEFDSYYRWFEVQKSNYGFRRVGDGINWSAIFAIRAALCELPKYLALHDRPMDHRRFLETIKTEYCSRNTLQVDAFKAKKIDGFQNSYIKLIKDITYDESWRTVLGEITMRASQKNILDPLTGDATLYLTDRIIRSRHRMRKQEVLSIIEKFIIHKSGKTIHDSQRFRKISEKGERLLRSLFHMAYENRFGI